MSSGFAGYASVMTVGQEFINQALAAAAANAGKATFSLPAVVDVGSSKIGFSGSLSLTPPTVSLTANPDNTIDVTCGFSGTLRITDNGGSLVQIVAALTASVTVGIGVSVSPTSLAMWLDFSDTKVSAIDVKVSSGPPLPSIYRTAIGDPSVRTAFADALRAIPKSAVTFTVPGAQGSIKLSFKGFSVSVEVSSIVVVPLDGVLNIAADVAGYTAGDRSALVNLLTNASPTPTWYNTDAFGNVTFGGGTWGSHTFDTNMAIALNGGFLCALANGALATKLAGETIDGVTINSIALSLQSVESEIDVTTLPTIWYDTLFLSLDGSYSNTSFTVTAAATPVTFSIPSNSWIDVILITFDLSLPDTPWWEDVFLPVCALLGTALNDLVNTIADSFIFNMLANEGTSFDIPLSGTQTFGGFAGWTLSFTLNGMVVWVDGNEIDVYAVAAVSPPSLPPARPTFSLSIPGEGNYGHHLTDESPIPVLLTVRDASLFDSVLGLRVTWTAVRGDTDAVVLHQDVPLTKSALKIEIDRWSGDLKLNDVWAVTCEVYRPADSLIPRYTYYDGSIVPFVDDVVNRHHPYVRWNHTAGFHDPAGPGLLKSHHIWMRNRHSRIHRTDVHIRCERLKMRWVDWPDANEQTFGLGPLDNSRPAAIRPSMKGDIEYLDSLSGFGTFEDVARWRHGILCDYCFFGGPTKTEWKTPTLPTKPWE